MLIELQLCLPPEVLGGLGAADLAALGDGMVLPRAGERVRFKVQFAPGPHINPLSFLRRVPRDERRALVVVSPALIVDDGRGGNRASDAAEQLLKASWAQGVVVGLIGIGSTDVPGIDAVIAPQRLREDLHATLSQVACRLWYKLAPPEPDTRDQAPDLVLRAVRNKTRFSACLALRHRVYSSLGYLDAAIAASQIQLDFDGYDTRSKHFCVIDKNAGNTVVGTARLVSPSTLPQPNENDPTDYEAWCKQFANRERSRVYRDLLRMRSPASLPIVASFNHFYGLDAHQRYQELAYPQFSCEVSRVVVNPDYRGLGILRMLMAEAIRVASANRKRFLLLECAPFHQAMYEKLGFQAIKDNGVNHYRRAQRLDSWAVAMFLNLDNEHPVAASTSTFQLDVGRRDHAPVELAISDPRLDVQAIQQELNMPFVPPMDRDYSSRHVSKGTDGPLLAHLRLSLARLDESLDSVLLELHERLPGASVRLISGGEELPLFDQQDEGAPENDAIVAQIKVWLEGLHASA